MVLTHLYTVPKFIIETTVLIEMFTLSNNMLKSVAFMYICAHYPTTLLVNSTSILLKEYMMSSILKLSDKMVMKMD